MNSTLRNKPVMARTPSKKKLKRSHPIKSKQKKFDGCHVPSRYRRVHSEAAAPPPSFNCHEDDHQLSCAH